MKRAALYALASGAIMLLSTSALAQSTGPASTAGAQPAPGSPSTEVAANGQVSQPVPKEKVCEPVLIKAGPNQGQLVSKCHRIERSKADAQPR